MVVLPLLVGVAGRVLVGVAGRVLVGVAGRLLVGGTNLFVGSAIDVLAGRFFCLVNDVVESNPDT